MSHTHKLIETVPLEMLFDSFSEAASAMATDLTHEVTALDDEAFVRQYVEENNTKFAIVCSAGLLFLVRWDQDDMDTGKFYDEDDGWEDLPQYVKAALS